MANTPDRVGQLIGGRYELLQVIGRGGQGMVYRAFDRWTKHAVAVKVLSSKAAREEQAASRLMREQQAMSVLKGTAAVELFDVCRGHDGELCLVMELLKGRDLDEQLYALMQQRKHLPLARVGEIFDPIVSTLEVAHASGIVHRDLKPANIFVLENGGVRLLDFGMARLKNAAPLTAAGTVMGSPSFMAPEAWKGVSDLLDARADVYSLGVILFLVLAGDLPFEGDTVQAKFLAATNGTPAKLSRFRPDLPRGADAWADKALARDREQRFQSALALWDDFADTFGVKAKVRSKRASFWATAKGAVQRLARGNQPAPVPPAQRSSNEPSFTREALAKSAFHVTTPGDEVTLPERPVEKTLSMSDQDIVYENQKPPAPSAPPPRKR